MSLEHSCATCVFFVEEEKGICGRCHFSSPIPNWFPIVLKGDLCDNYKKERNDNELSGMNNIEIIWEVEDDCYWEAQLYGNIILWVSNENWNSRSLIGVWQYGIYMFNRTDEYESTYNLFNGKVYAKRNNPNPAKHAALTKMEHIFLVWAKEVQKNRLQYNID